MMCSPRQMQAGAALCKMKVYVFSCTFIIQTKTMSRPKHLDIPLEEKRCVPHHLWLTTLLSGNSYFSLYNNDTGKHFTYNVAAPSKPKDKESQPILKGKSTIFFVSGLTGSNNNSDYEYFGFIIFKHNQWYCQIAKDKTRLGKAPIALAFADIFNRILSTGKTSNKLEVWHEGRCCRCGLRLTVSESIQNGIGSKCAQYRQKEQTASMAGFTGV